MKTSVLRVHRGVTRPSRRAAAIGIVLLMTALPATHAQGRRPAFQDVLRLEPGRSVSTALDKGATYHLLERRAVLVRTVSSDGTVVSRRAANGDMSATLADRSGRGVASLRFEENTLLPDVVEMEAPTQIRSFLRSSRPRALQPTLDWTARQLIAFWRDRNAAGPRTGWQRDLLRPAGAPDRDDDASIMEIETQWANGLTARASRLPARVPAGQPGGGPRLYSVLTLGDQKIGWVQYFPQDRVMTFDFPGFTSGRIDAEALAEYQGWTFVPDLAWLNVQAFAFYDLAGPTADRASDERAAPGMLLAQLVNFFVPTVRAQDGCTGLHWLDGSIFRRCCDSHDRCYAKYGCNAYSWLWPFGQAWQCTACNAEAAYCFYTTGSWNPPYHDHAW